MSISTRTRAVSHHRNHVSRSNGDLKSLGTEAGSILSRAAGKTADQIKDFRSRVREGIEGAKDRVSHAAKAVRKQAVRTDKVIRAKPYHAIAIVAGVALLTGYLFGRRRSS
jgi:ElaB/YqjD/DUF883 family membrane-anchored ribosome-binding protein